MLYRILPEFDYFEPRTLNEALGLLKTSQGNASIMAGGISLLDDMKRGMANPPTALVSLQGIEGLKNIESGSEGLRLGALASIRETERSPAVAPYPLLVEAISNIRSVQVKTMGTVVGNVCVGTPASDILTALIALDAQLEIAGGNGASSKISAASLCVGAKKTKLKREDLVTSIVVPAPAEGSVGAYCNLTRTLPDISKLTVAVNLTVLDGTCTGAHVVLGAVAPVIVRSSEAEAALVGRELNSATIEAAAEAAYTDPIVQPISDIRSTAEYRKEQVRVLVRRALQTALSRSQALN